MSDIDWHAEWQKPENWSNHPTDNQLFCEHVFIGHSKRESNRLRQSHGYLDSDGMSFDAYLKSGERNLIGIPLWLCREHFVEYVLKPKPVYPEIEALHELQEVVFKHELG